MAGSVNLVFLIGNVGKDPEIRTSRDGAKIANFTMATGDQWTDKATGEARGRTEWHQVVVFNERTADVVERFVKKGSKVCVEGEIQTRKWQDRTGQDRYSTEIIVQKFKGNVTMLSSPDGERTQSSKPVARREEEDSGPSWSSPGSGGIQNDEVPF